MIKTALILTTAAASLGATTVNPPVSNSVIPAKPAHFEISAGPLELIRENGETRWAFDPSSDAAFRVTLDSGKTLNIHF